MGDYALCFFTDHADPAGRWYTTHGEIRGDASAYPYTPEDYRRVMAEIAAVDGIRAPQDDKNAEYA